MVKVLSVAVIGAGPAGLVAAKTLLKSQSGCFKVTLFEKSGAVGGIWGPKASQSQESMSPDMPTNMSRFTVSFSDLSWTSVDLARKGSPDPTPADLPMFPKAWHLGRYLQEYADKYLPEGTLRLNTKVELLNRTVENGIVQWLIKSCSGGSEEKEELFDRLIVATGIFGAPRNLSNEMGNDMIKAKNCKVLHTSQFRHLDDIVPSDHAGPGNILVIGGSISGVEAACNAALSLSTLDHSDSDSQTQDSSRLREVKVQHVMARPAYILPMVLPADPSNGATTFKPLDWAFFDIAYRPPGPAKPMHGRKTPEKNQELHSILRALVGGDQADLGFRGLVATDTNMPAYVGLSDQYVGLVRTGKIFVTRGRVDKLHTSAMTDAAQTKGVVDATISCPTETLTLSNVIGVIDARGYNSDSTLSFLPDDVKQMLDFDAKCRRLPLALHEHATGSPQVPDVGFVGMYDGPYWSVMEMQARAIAARWLKEDEKQDLRQNDVDVKELRQALASKDGNIPQYIVGDHVGIVEYFSEKLGVPRKDEELGQRSGPMIAARWQDNGTDRQEASKVLADAQQAIKISTEGRYVARATMFGLLGLWNVTRTLDSQLSTTPSGTFKGVAVFHPRRPTNPAYDFESLYTETGDFTTQTGVTFSASRNYAYRYRADADELSTWFIRDDAKTVDYLFNTLEFKVDEKKQAWIATADHLCVADNYTTEYQIQFRGISISALSIMYDVSGPSKHYTSHTTYRR